MKFNTIKYNFAEFTLEKDGNFWRLVGEKAKLPSTEACILAKLIQNKNRFIEFGEIDRSGNRVKIIQKIRLALGSNFIKKNNACEFIQTIHKNGYKWIYKDVYSYGEGSLLLNSIVTDRQEDLIVLSSYLKLAIASMVEENLNISVSRSEDIDDSSGNFSCSIEGNCICENGVYRLLLNISRHIEKPNNKSIEIQSDTVLQLIEETKTKVMQTLAEIFPEAIKEKKVKIPENYNASSEDLETENNEAVKYFLQGEYCWNKRDQQSVLQGLDCFEKAVAADPKFLSAWIGIAKSYVILCLQGSENLCPNDAIPCAVKALDKTKKPENNYLLSNRQLSDIEAVKGLIYFIYNWNQRKSFDSFKNSLQKAPRNYMARTWYAQCLIRAGNAAEAITEIEKARIHSGYTSSVTNTAYIQTLYLARKYEESISKAKEILDLTPNLRLGHLFWGAAAREIGDIQSALEHMEKTFSLFQNSAVISELGYTYGLAGKKAEAEELLRQLIKIRSQGNYASHYNDAKIYLGLKQIDMSFEELERAYEERSPWLAQLAIEPVFDSLRDDPRYEHFMLKIR